MEGLLVQLDLYISITMQYGNRVFTEEIIKMPMAPSPFVLHTQVFQNETVSSLHNHMILIK